MEGSGDEVLSKVEGSGGKKVGKSPVRAWRGELVAPQKDAKQGWDDSDSESSSDDEQGSHFRKKHPWSEVEMEYI